MQNQIYYTFLQDVAQGIWGETKLTYTDIINYFDKVNKNDMNVLEEIFWVWNSKLTDENEIDVQELENHIYNVIENN
jgi:hypothetical protein